MPFFVFLCIKRIMAATNISSQTLRRSEPLVRECFKQAVLHQPLPNTANALSHTPQLVVLSTWVGAKEQYAYKFVDAWKKRGFHVLHVTSTVKDLVWPKTGTEVTAARVTDFLMEKDQRDFNILLHGISIGGYLSQRTLMGLQETDVLQRIQYQVYDSFTHIAGFQAGVESAVNPRYKNIVSAAVKMYTKYADLSCLYEVSKFSDTVPTHTPTLFMHSLADRVAQFDTLHNMLSRLARGSPVLTFLLPSELDVKHVALFRHMGEGPYMSSIIRFLKQNKFATIQHGVLLEEDPNSETALENQARVKSVKPFAPA